MRLTVADLETDVLVVGAGAAGCLAAIRAAEAGRRVLMAAKTGAPGGVSVQARAGFQAALGHSSPADGPDVHFGDTMRAGLGLADPELVRVMVDDLPPLVRELDAWGVEFVKEGDGRFHQKWRPGSTHPRHVHHHDISGQILGRDLARKLEAMGIPILRQCMLLRLLVEEGAASGALAVQRSTGELLRIRAGAVVLACGGAGHVYRVTDNAGGTTGDGYAAAYLAGVELVDMEMVEFQFAVTAPPAMRGYPPNSAGWVTEGARFYNRLGERFVHRYAPGRKEVELTRAELIRFVNLEIYHGRGTDDGGVYMDASDIPPERQAEFAPHIARAFQKYGIDLAHQPMIVGPAAHTFLGGAAVGPEAQTSVPGLYAPGETSGGIHGANRLGGNLLAEALVFGARAGAHAARHAASRAPGRGDFRALVASAGELVDRHGSADPRDLRAAVQEVMHRCGTMIRDGQRLREGVEALRRLADRFADVGGASAANPAGFVQDVYEAYNMLLTGTFVLRSALAREESRGLHYRLDFPEPGGERWLQRVTLRRPPEGPEVEPELRWSPVAGSDPGSACGRGARAEETAGRGGSSG